MIIWVYDRFGNQIDCLSDVIDFFIDEDLGKIESIEFTVPGSPLQKGDYLLWRDSFNDWHEDIVSSCEIIHQGVIYQHVYAEDSIVELDLSYIDERNSYGFSNAVALERCLEGTRWLSGTVDLLGNNTIKFYHQSVYQGIVDLIDLFGGELTTEKLVNSNGVYLRRINWQKQCGADNGLMFSYGFDADQIERHVELDNVITRLHVFGKGEPNYSNDGDVSGYGRRITFSDINGGKDYLDNDEAVAKWGVVDGSGKIVHAEGSVTFEDCENPEDLLELGKEYLEQVSKPRIEYTANLAILANAGMDFKNVRKGDVVYIHDEVMDERLTGRITHLRRYETDGKSTEVTLGNVVRTVSNIFESQQATLESIKNRWAAWDNAANAGFSWLDYMTENLNTEINSTGGYVYWEKGEGITVYDYPKDQNPTKAIQLKGGALRIANSKTSTGDWNWSTFGTGDGFTADYINAGVIRGGSNLLNLETGDWLFTQGSIGDTAGLTYWDITNKAFRLTEANGRGIIYENGKLNIDASSVYIGTTTIQNWTRDQYEEIYGDLSGEISDLEKTIQTEIRTEISALEGQIKLKVSSGDVQSAITAALGKIDLTVTGALGSSASIKISADGKQLDSASLNLSGVRKAFAEDNKTNITISAGTLTFNGTAVTTFNGNTFVVNSTNFSVTKEGKITAKAGTIGGFTITDKSLYNGKTSLSSGTGVYVGTDGIGLGSNFYVDKSGNGKIGNFTFNSGKLYTNSKSALSSTSSGVYIASDGISLGANFKVTNAGVLTASSGTIGGFTIGTDRLTGSQIVVSSNIIDFKSSNDGSYIGSVGATWHANNSNVRFASLLTNTGVSTNYGIMFGFTTTTTLGVGKSVTTANMKGCVSKDKLDNLSISAGWNWYSNHDFHDKYISNCRVTNGLHGTWTLGDYKVTFYYGFPTAIASA